MSPAVPGEPEDPEGAPGEGGAGWIEAGGGLEAGGADRAVRDAAREKLLGPAFLETAYIPDFPFAEVQFWFVPSRAAAREVYHEFLLDSRSADKWETYYTKRGWRFIHLAPSQREAEGPFRAEPGELRPRILPAGRIFAPRPLLTLRPGGPSLPVVSLEKRRPLNPWKPNYIKALNFIRKYEWPHPLPEEVRTAIAEIEECGEVAGSTSWENARMLLEDNMSPSLQATLVDLFEKRPEDFPLGSEVYLRVLGRSGEEGFARAAALHSHPMSRKRKHVAQALGSLEGPEGLEALFVLLGDEDPEIHSRALRSLGRVGVPQGHAGAEKLRPYLEGEDVSRQVCAAAALLKGGDEAPRKLLLGLVKEREDVPLSDLGELGEILSDLKLVEAVPYLIQRLKSERSEVRTDAAETLRVLTGLPVKVPPGDEEARRQAVRACTRWWEESKRERRRLAAERG